MAEEAATNINEDSPLPSSPKKPISQEEQIWLPPLRLGDFRIQDSPYKVLTRSGSKQQARSSVLQQKDNLDFTKRIEKLKAGSASAEPRGLARLGALTARSERLNRAKAAPSPRRPQSSRNVAGALGWLYREPEADDHRMNSWILSNPAPECMLRQALRTPLSVSSPRDFASQSTETPAPQDLSTAANDLCEKHTEHIGSLVQEVGRYRPPDTPVLEAGRKRIERIKQFVADELQLLEEERVAAEEELRTREMITRDSPEARALNEDLKQILLDTSITTSSRSRGIRGLADPNSGYQRLMERCQGLKVQGASISKIAAYLVEEAETDEHRAWSLFCWLSCHVRYDAAGAVKPEAVLLSREAECTGFAQLYSDLCTEAGLTGQVVSGHARSHTSQQMEDLRSNTANCHSWNCVKLDGEWVLVDCTRAAGFCGRGIDFVKSFYPYFFGPDPDELAYTHFPADSQFQLLDCPLDYGAFLSQPQVNPEVFYGLNLGFCTEERSMEAMPKFIGETNAGFVVLRVPRNIRVKASLDGDETLCFLSSVVRKTRLRITVISASCLSNMDLGGADKSDPYCKIAVSGKPHLVWTTKVVQNTLDPVWNQTFYVDEIEPGDKLVFEVYDQDLTTRHDLLGKFAMPTGPFHIGRDFDGEVDLEEDGALGSKLKLCIEVLPSNVASVPPSSEGRRGSAEARRSLTLECRRSVLLEGDPTQPELLAVHFRTQNRSSRQKLEVHARSEGSSTDLFRRACSWIVQPPAQPQDFIVPFFPNIYEDVFKKYCLDFLEAWPVGHIEVEQSEVNLAFCAPFGVQAIADVDGNCSRAIVQPGPALDMTMEVRAQIPAGAHDLNIRVRPSNPNSDFERALSYRIVRKASDPLGSADLVGFPESTNMFREVRARLEEPLTSRLYAGRVRFSISLAAEYSSQVTLVTGGRREKLARKSDNKSGRRASASSRVHVWEALLPVFEPEALLLSSVRGEMQPLLRWAVVAEPAL